MVKAKLYRQNHRKKHTHTHSQKEKNEKNIYIYLWEVWGLLSAFSRCSVRIVPHVDVFLIYLWGGRWSPRLTPPPSWRFLPGWLLSQDRIYDLGWLISVLSSSLSWYECGGFLNPKSDVVGQQAGVSGKSCSPNEGCWQNPQGSGRLWMK